MMLFLFQVTFIREPVDCKRAVGWNWSKIWFSKHAWCFEDNVLSLPGLRGSFPICMLLWHQNAPATFFWLCFHNSAFIWVLVHKWEKLNSLQYAFPHILTLPKASLTMCEISFIPCFLARKSDGFSDLKTKCQREITSGKRKFYAGNFLLCQGWTERPLTWQCGKGLLSQEKCWQNILQIT